MPKFNMYQALHTTVIGPEGRPLEIQIRTARHARDGRVRRRRALALQGGHDAQAACIDPTDSKLKWLKSLLDWQQDADDPKRVHRQPARRAGRGRGLRLHAQGRGQVARRRRDAAGLRLRDPHRRRPPLRRRQGQRQDRAAALRAAVGRHRRDPHLQARARPVARLARARQDDPRPQQDPRLVQGRVARRLRAHRPRAAAGAPQQGRPAGAEAHRLAAARRRDPRDGLQEGRRLLHRARRRQDLAEGRRQQGPAAPQAGRGRRRGAVRRRRPARPAPQRPRARPGGAARRKYGIRVEGVDDVPLRLAKCCRPVSGDPIVGYVSLGRGITIHREDCPNAAALRKDPERFVPGLLGRRQRDRRSRSRSRSTRGTATACSRTSRARSPRPASTSSRRAASSRTRWSRTASWSRWGTPRRSSTAINRLRAIDAVFDAYRVTPGGG